MLPIGWLLKIGLSEKVAGILRWVIPLVVLIGAIWWLRADAYSDGEKDADARWVEAGIRAEKKVVKAAVTADEKQAVRQADFAEEVRIEKEKLDVAVAEGSSPFDVLFPSQPVPEDLPVAP